MATPNIRIRKIIDKYIVVLQRHISIDIIYLFGSYTRGENRRHSDIDLAIVSRDFEKQPPFERLVFLGKIAWEAGTPIIEAIGYTPKEFATKSPLEFPSEIKKNGIAIRQKDQIHAKNI